MLAIINKTLDSLPSGVLILEKKEVSFVNLELRRILALGDIFDTMKEDVKEKLGEYFDSQSLNQAQDLWSYIMTSIAEGLPETERVFEHPSKKLKYLQVKMREVVAEEQIIVIITDVSNIKEFEKQSQHLRSMFFSSVAHELRTPLNSMIPILKLAISMLSQNVLNKQKLT